MTSTVAADAAQARLVYADRVVDKRLATQRAFSRLPRYVTEYLLAKYVRPGHEDEDIAVIKERMRGRIPEADQKEIVKNRLLRDGRYVLIDQLEVEVDLALGRHWGRLNSLDSESIGIERALVDRFEGLLNGGLWGTCTLAYDGGAGARDKIRVVDFVPFQINQPDVVGYKAGRAQFTTEEWIRLLLRSAGYEPDALPSERQRWLLLARLIPLVERNVNMVELGPRGTGKTFLLRNLSPAVFTISGGRPSPAALFLHKVNHRIGILGTRKVVVFDEIAATTFPDKETIATLKDYMESGQYSRGKKVVASDASVVFAGNIDVAGDQPSQLYSHLFEDLPPNLIDVAFLDRLSGYLPGWEVPKVSEAGLAQGVGFVTDYFGEVLRELRDDDFIPLFEGHRITTSPEPPPELSVRAVRGAKRVAAGMLKLLHPDRRFTDSELQACLRFGLELRQRVDNQLSHLQPGEFPRRTLTFAGMASHEARDLHESMKVLERDVRANREALIGHVTGLVVTAHSDAHVGGDVFFVEAATRAGRPGVSVTGLRGAVLVDAVKTAHQVLLALGGEWAEVAKRAKKTALSVHLVNLANAREGAASGVAFAVAMASALLERPVRPGVAMTGGLSLHGHLGAATGIAEKTMAAVRHLRTTLILPAANASDLRDVPDDLLARIATHPVERIEDVLALALA